jgi:hypothetical protein
MLIPFCTLRIAKGPSPIKAQRQKPKSKSLFLILHIVLPYVIIYGKQDNPPNLQLISAAPSETSFNRSGIVSVVNRWISPAMLKAPCKDTFLQRHATKIWAYLTKSRFTLLI